MAATSVLFVAACTPKAPNARDATEFFRGAAVAQVSDVVDGSRVERRTRLASTSESIATVAYLDVHGFALRARYQRGALRTVALEPQHGVDVLVDGSGAKLALKNRALIIDLLRYADPPKPSDVTLVDLASGDAIDGKIERREADVVVLDTHGAVVARANVQGVRIGPGAFAEGDLAPSLDTAPIEPAWSGPAQPKALRIVGVDDVLAAMNLDGPGQHRDAPAVVTFDAKVTSTKTPLESDRAPALFVESADVNVAAFAHQHATNAGPLADAKAIASAVHEKVDANARDLPPSAKLMLDKGGDCDGAAALVAASLRSLGHAARVVSGYVLVDGNRFAPHAWAEVYGGDAGWVVVDAASPDAPRVQLFDGLGSALTMGRVLGRVRFEPAHD